MLPLQCGYLSNKYRLPSAFHTHTIESLRLLVQILPFQLSTCSLSVNPALQLVNVGVKPSLTYIRDIFGLPSFLRLALDFFFHI